MVPHKVNGQGVDIEIEGYDVGIEIWNHSKQHAYQERLESVIKNLSDYTNRFHVVSFISPEYRKIEEDNGITVIELEFQAIKDEYLDFYKKNYRHKRKKTLNKRTLKTIGNSLKPVLDTIKKQQIQKREQQIRDTVSDIAFTGITNRSHVCSTSSINTEHKSSLKTNQKTTETKENLLDFVDKAKIFSGFKSPETRKTKLTCGNCAKRRKCEIMDRLQKLEATKPRRETTQTDLLDSFTRNTSPGSLMIKLEEWITTHGDEYYELQDKQVRCLNEKTYLHEKKKFKVFDVD